MKCTIEEVESRLEQGISKLRSPEYVSLETLLHPLVPKGYRVHVSLLDKKGRKKRKNASAETWSPESGEVRIYFEPDDQSSSTTSEARPARTAAAPESVAQQTTTESSPISDLVRALDRAESKPGYDFVALKWFRDVVLPAEGLDWAHSESLRQTVLRDAIEKRLVLTSRVPNPKAPQFPVTAIRLNRLLPDTRAILGEDRIAGSDFLPVEIRGESLSTTILRERR